MNEDTERMRHEAEEGTSPTKTQRTMDHEEVPDLASHGDPSTTAPTAGAVEETTKRPQRGVAWVRPSELTSLLSAKAAGRGIDFHAELARRSRRLSGQAAQRAGTGRRAISERAHRLPPVSAFGHRGASQMGPTRSGVGLS